MYAWMMVFAWLTGLDWILENICIEKQRADDSKWAFCIIWTMTYARKITAFHACAVDTVHMQHVMTVPKIITTISPFSAWILSDQPQ